jgi:antitoxin (DNA-binding transcriptional repressor) of toxin-antitoxin stability system
MQQATIHQAKTHLSRLIRAALSGEEVIIANRRIPVVRLQPLGKGNPKRRIGACRNFIRSMAKDFCAPLDDFGDYEP